MRPKITRFGLFSALCSLFFFSITNAQLVTKSNDDGSDGTLRQEIADTPPGGTITFAEGVETILLTEGELLIEKELTISADSTARVTIDAQMQSRIFNITAGPVSFNYLNLINGFTEDNGAGIQALNTDLNFNYTDISSCVAFEIGGAAYINGASNVIVNHGTIQGNIAVALGGGFYIKADQAMLKDVLIDGNGSDDGSGGIFCTGGDFLISGCMISNNQIAYNTDVFNNGAGLGTTLGNMRIVNSTFTNNGSRNYGGAIFCDSSTLEISDSEIRGNYAQYAGAGLYLSSNSLVTLNNVNITANSGENPLGGVGRNDGGGINASGNEDIVINGGSISGNEGYRNGGGIFFDGGTLTINGTEIANNSANLEGFSEGGGGIYHNSGQLILNAGTWLVGNTASPSENNTVEEGGGGILMEGESVLIINSSIENPVTFQGNVASKGGAIASRSSQTLDLNNVVFTENSANYGGALHTTSENAINITGGSFSGNGQGDVTSIEGGAVWNSSGTLNIDGTTFSDNNADEKGGAIYNNGGTVNINNAAITGNTSFSDLGTGGAIFNDNGGSLSITGSSLANNGAVAFGGAIADNSTATAGSVTLTDVILRDNFANGQSGSGGALYLLGNGTAMIRSSEISGNNADNQGGAIWNGGASINIMTSTISGNVTAGLELDENNDGNGGAIYNSAGGLFINASTLVLNKADGRGGAIYNASAAASTTLKNSIVALNTAAEGNNLAGENDFISADYNLIGEDNLGVFDGMSNDLMGTSENPLDPMIDSLANNGGFTQTHALLDGSPAYNAGNPIDDFTDQRGEAVFGGRRDIGAFEAQMTLGTDNSIAASTKSILYPNPSNGGTVQLNIPGAATSAVQISVIEIGSGKVVLSQEGKSGRNILKTEGLQAGTYVIRLVSDRTAESLKLIVSR